MQPEVDKDEKFLNEDEFLKKFVSVSEEDFLLNTEIVQREYSKMTEGYTPFFKNMPSEFSSWIRECMSIKVFLILAAIYSSIVTTFHVLFNHHPFAFFLYVLLFFFSLMGICSFAPAILKTGSRSLFKRFNISISSQKKEDLVKLLSLTSLLMNNSLIDKTEEAKLDILKKVSIAFNARHTAKVVSQIDDLLCGINKIEYNTNNFGFRNKDGFNSYLDKNENLKGIQNKFLSLFIGKPSSKVEEIDMKDGFVKGLFNSEISEDDASALLNRFVAQFKKKFILSITSYSSGIILTTCFFTTIFLALFSLLFFTSVVGFSLSLTFLISFLIALLPPLILLNQYKRIDNFLNSLLDNGVNNKALNVNINKLALLSIGLKTKDAKYLKDQDSRLSTLNKLMGSCFYGDYFDFLSAISKIEIEMSRRKRNEEIDLAKRLKSSKVIQVQNPEFSVGSERNVDEMVLAAKKDMLHPSK